MKKFYTLLLLLAPLLNYGQYTLKGRITDAENKSTIPAVVVQEKTSGKQTKADASGTYLLEGLSEQRAQLTFFAFGYKTVNKTITLSNKETTFNIRLEPLSEQMNEVVVSEEYESDIVRLQAVEKSAIYEAKKNEVILAESLSANKASNNARQVYAKVPGLNIWESDGAGIQLSIGARGLDPSRTSNFNVRQNGYDISADPLGYPESYYTPPVEGLKKIEIVRGASSLQYGPQFGGMVNFVMKDGSDSNKPIHVQLRQSGGSYGFFNSFNALQGKQGKIHYYTFYQHKQGNGWRENSDFDLDMYYGTLSYHPTEKLSIKGEYTHMSYLAQQAGGLTRVQFEEDPRLSYRNRNWFQVDWNLFALTVDYKFNQNLSLNLRNFGLIGGRDALGNLQRIDRPDNIDENRNLFADDFANFGQELRLLYRYQVNGRPAAFLTGVRYFRGNTHRMQGDASPSEKPEFNFLHPNNVEDSDFDFQGTNLSFFVENVFNVTDRLSITPGARLEYIATDAKGYYQDKILVPDPETGLAMDSTFKVYEDKRSTRPVLIGGIGVSYRANAALEVYSNFSQNYRPINFNDIRVNNPNLVVDENIMDERGYNFDLGIRGGNKKVTFDVSTFFLKYNNKIGNIYVVDENYDAYRLRTNVANSIHVGLEAFGEINFMEVFNAPSADKQKVSLYTNLSLTNARYVNTDNNAINNKQVEQVPPINLKTGLLYKYDNFKTSLQFGYTHEHYTDATNAEWTPTEVEGLIPSYYVADLSMSYQYKFLVIEGNINNLTNNMYFTRRATGYPGPGIIPSEGRTMSLTLEVHF
ncbi:TonB-dependent receptor [Algivirga pacifica]|uniref:TonB-dependent receptor n=1 Tax=Algivirga pacifica TaxID=1162670 RepID=A0ABP9DCA0_9BACT